MPVIHANEAVEHQVQGARFHSYAAPARGSRELCAWRLEVAPATTGLRHQVTREEVLCLLTGGLRAELDGETHDLGPGDVLVVPAGSTFGADNPASEPATAWVTTSAGLRAVLPDGTWFQPPWTL